MKIKYIKKIVLSLVFVFVVSVSSSFAQPDPPNGGGPTGGEVGGNAPIGGGTVMLLILGAAYGAKKVYNLVDKNEESLED